MLPYREIPSIEIYGPVGIHPFGVLVAMGILLGSWFGLRRARQAGIDLNDIRGAVLWSVISGFVGAHWVAVFAYAPHRLREEGFIVLLKLWDGISSFGGFVGGFIGLFTYLLLLRKPILPRVDIIMQAFVVGWIFGRLGCTVAFDHPGTVTDFFLAMRFPFDGQPRHNLGFYEFLWTALVILPTIVVMHRFRPRPGSYTVAVFLLYAPGRFLMDFLRATKTDTIPGGDARYWGLTPGHFGSILVFLTGIVLLLVIMRRPAESSEGAPANRESVDGMKDQLKSNRAPATEETTHEREGP